MIEHIKITGIEVSRGESKCIELPVAQLYAQTCEYSGSCHQG